MAADNGNRVKLAAAVRKLIYRPIDLCVYDDGRTRAAIAHYYYTQQRARAGTD